MQRSHNCFVVEIILSVMICVSFTCQLVTQICWLYPRIKNRQKNIIEIRFVHRQKIRAHTIMSRPYLFIDSVIFISIDNVYLFFQILNDGSMNDWINGVVVVISQFYLLIFCCASKFIWECILIIAYGINLNNVTDVSHTFLIKKQTNRS